MARKLGCRGVISAVRPGRLFYVTDSVSGRHYLVDTGSASSIMPWESTAFPSGPTLTAADGRHIPCWGERSFAVTIASVARRWDFLLAAVSFPIIGIDFLRHHCLLMDVANLRLLAGPPPPAAVCAINGAPEATHPAPTPRWWQAGLFLRRDPLHLLLAPLHLLLVPLHRLRRHRPLFRWLRIGRPPSAFVSRPFSPPLRRPPWYLPLMGCSTSSLPLASRALPDSAAWTLPGWRQPRRSSRPCWTRGSYTAPTASGAAPFTW